ncbi:tetratricopeptide repeat protein [Pseudobacteriovorax antillogorgiicola]|uniref:Tetratricopeptide repeat-containing protein n=1 Tax=Pseudobacteriovorax antillogorgiicola TaxID=1513793 RepID=A0A1Y6BPD5_9BACT|nr:tetratricopeptide repeat protein [Pseudobacteriovorax antillogorgiicola]TCS53918.1 tetratricopeptide repeat protein [Pseudobacteriovorax antillogorgiicola]SMF20589.1 Tetratricopeptide repeat-containing protein [Pseudobacteriovorax antillogorgiicola]
MRPIWTILMALQLFAVPSLATGKTVQEVVNRKPQTIEGGRSGTIRERSLKRLTKAQQLMSTEKYDAALEILQGLEKSLSGNKFGLAQVYQTSGYVYAQSDRFAKASEYFRKTIELNSLPKTPTLNTMYSLAQVLVAEERYIDAVPYIQDYLFNKEPQRAEAFFFYGQVLAQLKQMRMAAVQVEKALKLTDSPKESWLRLLVALYFEQKLYSKAAVILEKLVNIKPDKNQYWKQLSSVYIAMNQDSKALAVLEVAYKNKVLTEEKDLLQLIRLSLFEGVPYKAGVYLQKALDDGAVAKTSKHFELLAESWIQAQEVDRALTALDKAAPLSSDGKLYVRQGQLYLEKEKWKESIAALKKGIEKGGLKKEGLAYVALGIAHYNSGATQSAIESFRKAKAFPKFKKQAAEWINHVNTEVAITH